MLRDRTGLRPAASAKDTAAGAGDCVLNRSLIVERATKDLSVGPTERLFARCSRQNAL